MPSLSSRECLARFASSDRVVLGTAGSDGVPHLVPVTFALLDHSGHPGQEPEPGKDDVPRDVIVTVIDHKPKRTTQLRRLRNIGEQPRVSLLADAYSTDWSALWWVRADARAEVLAPGAPSGDPAARYASAIEALVARYPQYGRQVPDGAVIWATVDRWVGWTGGPPAAFAGTAETGPKLR